VSIGIDIFSFFGFIFRRFFCVVFFSRFRFLLLLWIMESESAFLTIGDTEDPVSATAKFQAATRRFVAKTAPELAKRFTEELPADASVNVWAARAKQVITPVAVDLALDLVDHSKMFFRLALGKWEKSRELEKWGKSLASTVELSYKAGVLIVTRKALTAAAKALWDFLLREVWNTTSADVEWDEAQQLEKSVKRGLKSAEEWGSRTTVARWISVTARFLELEMGVNPLGKEKTAAQGRLLQLWRESVEATNGSISISEARLRRLRVGAEKAPGKVAELIIEASLNASEIAQQRDEIHLLQRQLNATKLELAEEKKRSKGGKGNGANSNKGEKKLRVKKAAVTSDSSRLCFSCSSSAHLQRQCPIFNETRGRCKRCGEEGHHTQLCPPGSPVRCLYCAVVRKEMKEAEGHSIDDCQLFAKAPLDRN